jgi:hypothetical protein
VRKQWEFCNWLPRASRFRDLIIEFLLRSLLSSPSYFGIGRWLLRFRRGLFRVLAIVFVVCHVSCRPGEYSCFCICFCSSICVFSWFVVCSSCCFFCLCFSFSFSFFSYVMKLSPSGIRTRGLGLRALHAQPLNYCRTQFWARNSPAQSFNYSRFWGVAGQLSTDMWD